MCHFSDQGPRRCMGSRHESWHIGNTVIASANRVLPPLRMPTTKEGSVYELRIPCPITRPSSTMVDPSKMDIRRMQARNSRLAHEMVGSSSDADALDVSSKKRIDCVGVENSRYAALRTMTNTVLSPPQVLEELAR